MVAEARTSRLEKAKPLKFTQPKLLTFDDYARMTPPESGNYELHNGKIIHTPSPLYAHHKVLQNLVRLLGNYVYDKQIGTFLFAPMDVIFNENDTMQPDILFVSNERSSIIDRQIKGAPVLLLKFFLRAIRQKKCLTKNMFLKRMVCVNIG